MFEPRDLLPEFQTLSAAYILTLRKNTNLPDLPYCQKFRMFGSLTNQQPMKTPTLKTTKTSGFSLVELLVVIAVIAIIAAIAIPNIANVTGAAETARNQRNAQNIASVWSAARAVGATDPGTKDTRIIAVVSSAGLTGSLAPFNQEGQSFSAPMAAADANAASIYLGDELQYIQNPADDATPSAITQEQIDALVVPAATPAPTP